MSFDLNQMSLAAPSYAFVSALVSMTSTLIHGCKQTSPQILQFPGGTGWMHRGQRQDHTGMR